MVGIIIINDVLVNCLNLQLVYVAYVGWQSHMRHNHTYHYLHNLDLPPTQDS